VAPSGRDAALMGELPPEEVVPPKEPAPKESMLLWLAD
jgi:hypothetical protein